MSNRNKLQKFSEVLTFPNVVQNFNSLSEELIGKGNVEVARKGVWASEQFGNQNPICLELACGRGEYAIQMGRQNPNQNFIGIDVKGARIWKGAKIALDEGLTNVAFLRGRIELIARFFGEQEVDEIWITFPDPFLKKRKSNRRLTSPVFLKVYRQFLKKGGIIHLKTDEPLLYNFTLEVLEKEEDFIVLEQVSDLYSAPREDPRLYFKTRYEHMHIAEGEQITYIKFQYLPK